MTTDILTEQWLQQVLEEHRELRALVSELQAFLDQPRPEVGQKGAHTWAADLSARLVELHDKLFRHFRFEEEGGMREELVQRHPRAAQRIEKVLDEHPEMLSAVRQLMSDALAYSEGQVIKEPQLRQRIARVIKQLERHEHEETDLIQRLEYRDLGAAE